MTVTHGARNYYESGFSLLELLVSLVVLSVTMVLLSAGFQTMSSVADKNRTSLENIDMISRGYNLIKRDAQNLRRVIYLNKGQPRYIFTGKSSSVEFVALEPPFPSRSALYFIRYRIEKKGTGNLLIRERARFAGYEKQFLKASPANTVEVFELPTDFRFIYGAAKQSASPAYFEEWPYTDRLPDLIGIRSSLSRDKPIFLTPIRANAEMTCVGTRTTICSAGNSKKISVKFSKKDNARIPVDR